MAKRAKKTPPVCVVSLDMGTEPIIASGESILEALGGIVFDKYAVKGMGRITARVGKKIASVNLFPIHLRRFVVNRNYRTLLAKRLEQALQ